MSKSTNVKKSATPATEKATQNEHHVEREENDEEDEEDVESSKTKAEESSAMKKLDAKDEDNDKAIDVNTMKHLLSTLKAAEEADKQAILAHEKELAAIKISKDDVALLSNEMNLTSAIAERKLREANGNLEACLKTLLQLA